MIQMTLRDQGNMRLKMIRQQDCIGIEGWSGCVGTNSRTRERGRPCMNSVVVELWNSVNRDKHAFAARQFQAFAGPRFYAFHVGVAL